MNNLTFRKVMLWLCLIIDCFILAGIIYTHALLLGLLLVIRMGINIKMLYFIGRPKYPDSEYMYDWAIWYIASVIISWMFGQWFAVAIFALFGGLSILNGRRLELAERGES